MQANRARVRTPNLKMSLHQLIKTALSFSITAALGLSLAPAEAIAQSAPSRDNRLLSVNGSESVVVPAQQGVLMLSYILNYSYMPAEEGQDYSQIQVTETDAAAIVEALVGAGISRDKISFQKEAYNYQGIRVLVQLDRPTSERVDTLFDLATTAAIEDGKLANAGVLVAYTVNNCAAAEDAAREAAIAAGRRQAQKLAAAAGVSLGEMVAISESTTWPYTSTYGNDCPADLEKIMEYSWQYGTSYLPGQPAEVSVNSDVSLTYKIE